MQNSTNYDLNDAANEIQELKNILEKGLARINRCLDHIDGQHSSPAEGCPSCAAGSGD